MGNKTILKKQQIITAITCHASGMRSGCCSLESPYFDLKNVRHLSGKPFQSFTSLAWWTNKDIPSYGEYILEVNITDADTVQKVKILKQISKYIPNKENTRYIFVKI